MKRPREELVFHFPHYQGDSPHSAIILGRYKLIKWYEGQTALFNLKNDPGESDELSANMPEKVGELDRKLMKHLERTTKRIPIQNANWKKK